ncbi:hypothetical protein C2W62_13485 [Candidatus Entotheonella serta]|nr:hypothetical protein C2W62_13485 [Candidatus Entotheonella serta]
MQVAEFKYWLYPMARRPQTSAAIDNLRSLAWPVSQLDEALYLLADKSGLLSREEEPQRLPPTLAAWRDGELERWFSAAAVQLKIEVEPVHVSYREVNELIGHGAPVLLPLPVREPGDEEPHFVALLKGRWGWVAVLGIDGLRHWVRASTIHATVCHDLEAQVQPEIERLLDAMELPTWRRLMVRSAILQESLSGATIDGGWLLRLSSMHSLWRQVRQSGSLTLLLLSVAGQVFGYATLLLSIALIGKAVVGGYVAWSPLMAGILVWLSGLPFLLLSSWAGSIFETRAAIFLKERLFHGVLQLELEEVNYQGIGQFLTWVMESEALEKGALSQLPSLLQAIVPLVLVAFGLLLVGDIGIGGALLGWLTLTGWLSLRMFQQYGRLNAHFTEMSTDSLERIRGHQTRLIQENDWYEADDHAVSRYIALGRALDRENTLLWILMPYGWIVIMLVSFTVDVVAGPGFVASETKGLRFAALLFGVSQFQFLAAVLPDIAKAVAAWQMIAPLQQAASRHAAQEQPLEASVADVNVVERPRILEARGLTFRYQPGGCAILNGCDLDIYQGDRLLLEGPSGGGKSTLASLLIGLHKPESGLLLVNGLDHYTLSEKAWRTCVVAAPQFHENHILNASFAFNVLLGRCWPPSPEDLVDAENICRELGLGELLDRMPMGLQQMIGDQGWRLSHGERSRLYIARALLQQADIIILDESFGSIDPENMQMALQSVLRRSSTLLVIAHP